jgi:hypothetical protein
VVSEEVRRALSFSMAGGVGAVFAEMARPGRIFFGKYYCFVRLVACVNSALH